VIDQILERREKGIPLKQQAVLFARRITVWHWKPNLDVAMCRFVKYGGLRFLETAHVRDLMSFLRLAENPLDSVAGFRVLVLDAGNWSGQSRIAAGIPERSRRSL
jgi:DNA helicase II / ATP-dependent DNA helicase PcrA